MMLNENQMKQAINKYNDIMGRIGYEHNQIGTRFSENTENWNLRDMVAECDYTLSCYYENGHCNNDLRYSDEPEERKMWRDETRALRNFINKYKNEINDMECSEGHCSSFD